MVCRLHSFPIGRLLTSSVLCAAVLPTLCPTVAAFSRFPSPLTSLSLVAILKCCSTRHRAPGKFTFTLYNVDSPPSVKMLLLSLPGATSLGKSLDSFVPPPLHQRTTLSGCLAVLDPRLVSPSVFARCSAFPLASSSPTSRSSSSGRRRSRPTILGISYPSEHKRVWRPLLWSIQFVVCSRRLFGVHSPLPQLRLLHQLKFDVPTVFV